ncbi:hypothetical protein K466DRAFT_588226 [Polyporus arcularius HHB13444]|uniref:Uncharacterized protein n=1 Tax=Polyporus arcularius HHB13444 TaxID=1314778 RepID=A0A5C3P7Q2_9APHY|nr:hypothetical protein K466DRAFT_588226 [Polyporus arcularius HHB13444]
MSFPSDKVSSGHSQTVCLWFAIAVQAMEILQFLPGAAFSALRVYVLSRSKPLGLLVATLSLAPVGANLVLFGHQYSGANFPPFGCLSTVNTTPELNLSCTVVIISRVPLIAADILLVYITWTKLSSSATLADIRQSKRRSLSDTLFRGGIILFALNVLHLLLTATAVSLSPLTAILVSRFLLDLQEANQMVVRLDPDDPLHSSRGSYDSAPSFISSLGGFVNPNPSERSDDDDGLDLQVRLHSGAPEVEEGVGVQAVPSEGAAASLSPTA